ncbi:hypothetical protein D5039_05960 [Verminephrobacter aporrectodeae subsp. tuberculatae]|uniref:Uncharacterized protein n=1 Tax=Verminephrobacter aporrectodeae subsp. tuberculatae TaxID=1110392 RepID=A0ABT3KQX7_9BURK|nr:hypothetical protein [Verminephrobacter aporrectodeae subsp. tuberculatae]
MLSACPLSLPSWLPATRGGCVVGVLPGLSWGLTTRGAEAAAECWLLLVLAVAGPWGWSAAGLGLSGAALWMDSEPALPTGRAASLLAGFRVLFPPATGRASAGVVLLPPLEGGVAESRLLATLCTLMVWLPSWLLLSGARIARVEVLPPVSTAASVLSFCPLPLPSWLPCVLGLTTGGVEATAVRWLLLVSLPPAAAGSRGWSAAGLGLSWMALEPALSTGRAASLPAAFRVRSSPATGRVSVVVVAVLLSPLEGGVAESRLLATLYTLMVWLPSWLLLSGARIARVEVLPPVSTAASVLSFCPLPLPSWLPCVLGLTTGGVEATAVRWLLLVSLPPAAAGSRGWSAEGLGLSWMALEPALSTGRAASLPAGFRVLFPPTAGRASVVVVAVLLSPLEGGVAESRLLATLCTLMVWLPSWLLLSGARIARVEVLPPVSTAASVLSFCPLPLPSWLPCVLGLTTGGVEATAVRWLLLVSLPPAAAGSRGWSAEGLGLSWMALEPALSTGRAASLPAGFRVLFPPTAGRASVVVVAVLLPPLVGGVTESRLSATSRAPMVWLPSWLLLSGARIARVEVLPPVFTAASVLSFCPLPLPSWLPCVLGLTTGGVEATAVRWLLLVSLPPAAAGSWGWSAAGLGLSGAASWRGLEPALSTGRAASLPAAFRVLFSPATGRVSAVVVAVLLSPLTGGVAESRSSLTSCMSTVWLSSSSLPVSGVRIACQMVPSLSTRSKPVSTPPSMGREVCRVRPVTSLSKLRATVVSSPSARWESGKLISVSWGTVGVESRLPS